MSASEVRTVQHSDLSASERERLSGLKNEK